MAILIFNKSLCPICQRPIKEGDDYYSFPSFVVNTKEPLYFFNDQTFHLKCLKQDKLGEIARTYAGNFAEKVKPPNRRCIIGGNLITTFEDHIFIDLLTSDQNSFLHQFNFAHIDKKNLAHWQEREGIISELVKMYRSDTWQEVDGNNYLLNLIERLS
jgi:hypothetical protein